jgi:hypothetical protein
MEIAVLQGKTPTERNKMIAAAALGVIALLALYFAFGRSGGSSASVTVKTTASAKPTASPAVKTDAALPTTSEQDFAYQTMPVVYQPGNAYAPDPGRNIFAFYEPPPPCKAGDLTPRCVSPIPSPSPVKPPTPLPTPPILLASVNPQMVYAGSRAFRLELAGDKFTPDSHIYFNQTELPTTFINAQKVVADVPAKFISSEGSPQIIVQTPDGKLYSNQIMMSVQAPPKPTVIYVGMIGHKGFNNDKAVLAEDEKAPPFSARLNDVVQSRFRLVDISPAAVMFEDVSLGFRHRVPISKGILQGSMPPGRGNGLSEPGIPNYNPGMPQPQEAIPGIPNNLQRQPMTDEERKKRIEQQQQKQDVDDDGDG